MWLFNLLISVSTVFLLIRPVTPSFVEVTLIIARSLHVTITYYQIYQVLAYDWKVKSYAYLYMYVIVTAMTALKSLKSYWTM